MSNTPKICKVCQTYLLDHEDLYLRNKGWKKCPSCGWACDKEGQNLINKKLEKDKENVNK